MKTRYYIYGLVILVLVIFLFFALQEKEPPTFEDYKNVAQSNPTVSEIISGNHTVNATVISTEEVLQRKADNHPFYGDIPAKTVIEFEYLGTENGVMVVVDEKNVLLEVPITRLRFNPSA